MAGSTFGKILTMTINGDAHIMVDGGTFTAPTIDEALYSGIHSSQMDVRNYSKYSDSEADRLLDEARITLDETQELHYMNSF